MGGTSVACGHADGSVWMVELGVKDQEGYGGVRAKTLVKGGGGDMGGLLWARSLLVVGVEGKV